MSEIDVLLQYASKAAALADPALSACVAKDQSGNATGFDQSYVFDQQGAGLQVWNTAQDTTAAQTGPNGQSFTVTQHTFQPGYSLIVSYVDPTIAPGQVNANAASLAPWKANPACLLITDRDAANAGNPGFVYFSASAITPTLAQWRLQPVPLGALYPFGSP